MASKFSKEMEDEVMNELLQQPLSPRKPALPAINGMTPEQVERTFKAAEEWAKPKGASPVPSAPEDIQRLLKQAEGETEDRRMWAGMREAGSKISEAISGVPMDKEYLGRLRADAERPMTEAKRKEKEALDYAKAVVEGREKEFVKELQQRQQSVREAELAAREKEFGLKERGHMSDEDFKRAQLNEMIRHNRSSESIDRLQAAQRAAGAGGPAKGTVVPGYEVAPGAEPTAEDAKKVKASLASAGRMRGLVSELRALHSKHGTEMTGPVSERMRQLSTAIQLEAKNIAELGALSGPDKQLMEQLAGADPSSVGANLKGMLGVDNTGVALDGLEKWMDSQMAGNLQAYGYRRQGGEAPSGGGGDVVRVMAPDGKVRKVPRARLDAALAAGGRLVDG